MNLRKITIAFSAITVIVIMLSCKDKTPITTQCTSGCQSVLAAKEFFLFQPGSWWVYEEEYSHVRDSMYVYSYANGSDYTFDIEIKSATNDFVYHYWPIYNGQPTDAFCSKTNPVAKQCMFIKLSKYKIGEFLAESNCFFVQYNLKDSLNSYSSTYPNNRIKFTEINDSFNNGYLNFDETVIVQNNHTYQDDNQKTLTYYSKGVGITRRELIDSNQTWNLVNYHIEE